MNLNDIIKKQNDREPLTKEEIAFAVNGYANNTISDKEITPFIKNIYDHGMTSAEISALTEVMRDSGDVMDLSFIEGTIVDKHSTGGIGDKTSLIVCPIVASLGVPVVKMSGRGLGFTGGTVDKMESIIGYREELTNEEMRKQVKDIGLVLMSQTDDLAPADAKIYALRDETDLVDSMPLIASSIMSKKLASGADKFVLDVKVGDGAFCKDLKSAKELASLMVKIGNSCGKESIALLTNMNEPLGFAIGNALEVEESIETLKGNGPKDLTELCLVLSAYMISLAKNISYDVAYAKAKKSIEDGSAYATWQELMEYHDTKGLIDTPVIKTTITSTEKGYVAAYKNEAIGEYVRRLGAGRLAKEDAINYNVGMIVHKKVGDQVDVGDELYTVYSTKEVERNNQFVTISSDVVEPAPLILDIIKE